jgi:hypothetical protein
MDLLLALHLRCFHFEPIRARFNHHHWLERNLLVVLIQLLSLALGTFEVRHQFQVLVGWTGVLHLELLFHCHPWLTECSWFAAQFEVWLA